MSVTLTQKQIEELLFELLRDERWGEYNGLPLFWARVIVVDYAKKLKELL